MFKNINTVYKNVYGGKIIHISFTLDPRCLQAVGMSVRKDDSNPKTKGRLVHFIRKEEK